jgi:hypothetical protein
MKRTILLITCFVFALSLISFNSFAQDKKKGKDDKKKTESVKSKDKSKKDEKSVKKEEKSKTVYVTDAGKAYHKKNCKMVKTGKKGISLEEAKKQGYTPCKICNPDK